MPLSTSSLTTLKHLSLNALLALAYVTTAKLGQSLAGGAEQITLIWPPSGIALGAILLWGYKSLPGIILGAILSRFVPGEIPISATYIALGNALGAVVAAYFLRMLNFGSRLGTARQVFLFLIFGAALSPSVTATLGSTSLIISDTITWAGFWNVWSTWWIGDFLGILLCTPLMLAWWDKWVSKPRQQILESIFIALLISATSLSIFFSQFLSISRYPIEYLIFPILIWGIFRFGQRGTTLSILLIAIIAVWATTSGYGPFAISHDLHTNLISLELFIVVLTITALLVSSIIEEKLKAERDLHDEEEKFRDLIEYSSDVFTIIDSQANIRYTSPSITKVLGYKPEEMQGTNVFLYVDPQDKDRLLGLFADILKVSHQTIHAKYRMLNKSGESLWIEGTGTNLVSEPGVGGIAVSYRNIDAQEKLDIVKTEFVTVAAHQLRTPLTTMKWYTEALRDLVKGKTKISQYVDAIYLSILKMNNLSNLMLNVSRVELGTFVEKSEDVEIKTLIETVTKDLNLEAAQKQLKLTIQYSSTIPPVITNPKMIHVILHNLISNAIRYTPSGGNISLTVGLRQKQLTLQVQDTGIGIPKLDQPKIFTKLFRASNSKSISPDGTGLGLYLTKALVDKQNGKIWFITQEGEGTTFFVQLPIKLMTRRPHDKK